MGAVALLLQLASVSSGIAAVTLLMLCADFLPAFLAPLAGVLADRIELRRLMLSCEAAQACLTALMVLFLQTVPVVLVLVFLRAVLGQVFAPASRAGVPELVADPQLPAANAAVGFGEHGLAVLGPVLAAVLIPSLGITGLLWADAGTFLLSFLLLLGLPRMPVKNVEIDRGAITFLRHAGRGLKYLGTSRVLRLVVISFALVVVCTGVDDVALVFLAKGPLGAGDSATGLLYAGSAMGLLVGFLVIGRVEKWLAPMVMLVVGYAVSSVGNLLTGLAGAVLVALFLQTFRGIGLAGMDVGAATIIQRTVPRAVQGRTFANFYGAVGLAAGASYLVGGALLQAVGPRLTFVLVGAGGAAVAAVTGLLLLKRAA
jgi:MFS family permease